MKDMLSVLLRLLLAVGAGLLALLLLLALIPPLLSQLVDQPFLKAYLALVVAFLCVSLGFGVMGALTARIFPLREIGVRPQTGPWRLAVTLAVSGGLLVVPGALLCAVGAAYQQGAFGANVAQGRWVFTLLAGVYGLLAGTVLGLLLVPPRHVWRLMLGGLMGASITGATVGFLAGLLNGSDVLGSAARIVLLVAALVLAVHIGWSLGIRVALWRLQKVAAGRGRTLLGASARQVFFMALVGLLALLAVSGLTRTLAQFVTAHAVDSTALRAVHGSSPSPCMTPESPQERALWQVSVQDGRRDLTCGNAVLGLVQMPGGEAQQPARSGFDDVATLVLGAQREVLFTTMQWDEGDLNPGLTLTNALAELYAQVKAHPEQYPDGMQVSITLGNYPVVGVFEWGAQVFGVLDDLKRSGVPLSNPALRWQVNLANYDGTFPHSHVKLLVIDGQTLVTAGFNYGYMHFPPHHPSGKGAGLFDLALVSRGPQAQVGVSIFDDLWARSKVVNCASPQPERSECQLAGSAALVHPAAARQPVQSGTQRVYTFYRRSGFTQADDAVRALYGASQRQIDLMHVNFSMDITCIVALLNPSLCTSAQQLPFMTALLDAMARGVNVRLLTDGSASFGSLENRIGVGYLQHEMTRRGIPAQRLQAKFFATPLHAKASLVDDRVLVIGSMNLHHSSWTQGFLGLNEAVSATGDPATLQHFRQLFELHWAQAKPMVLPQNIEFGGN